LTNALSVGSFLEARLRVPKRKLASQAGQVGCEVVQKGLDDVSRNS
jgi:hypothetical protein